MRARFFASFTTILTIGFFIMGLSAAIATEAQQTAFDFSFPAIANCEHGLTMRFHAAI